MKKENARFGGLSLKNRAASAIAIAMGIIITGVCLSFVSSFNQAPQIDVLLKGGHVIDPKNKIDAKMDVAIVGNKIFKVAANIPANTAKKVVDVTGLYVAPGFIDPHTHVFVGPGAGFANGSSSVKPDDFALKAGVTTVVDAGTSGWRNFAAFKKQVIDRSRTRVLVFLNAFGTGMVGGRAEQNVDDMDLKTTTDTIKKYSDIIVGIKMGHYDGESWSPFERAIEEASTSNIPLFVECHLSKLSLEGQLSRMRPGDIITHCYEKVSERTPIVAEDGKVLSYVQEARKKGVLFDVGHGGAGFWFSQAIPAVKQGFSPDSFGSDLHHNSVNSGMKDMMTTMSKFLNMGMSLQDVIASASWKPAQAIKRTDLGNLSEGSPADIAVFGVRTGKFGFLDAGNFKLDGTRKLENELTLRDGRVVYDLNGIAALAAWDKK
jgi:dihydroorotase